MDDPRLNGYPFDQRIVAELRARQRAREAAWQVRRASRPRGTGFWGLLRRILG